MQLTLGRRWVLDLRFSVSLQRRIEAACGSVRVAGPGRGRDRDAALRWERDKLSALMLSSWDQDLWRG